MRDFKREITDADADLLASRTTRNMDAVSVRLSQRSQLVADLLYKAK
jgi:hypothetical protein